MRVNFRNPFSSVIKCKQFKCMKLSVCVLILVFIVFLDLMRNIPKDSFGTCYTSDGTICNILIGERCKLIIYYLNTYNHDIAIIY